RGARESVGRRPSGQQVVQCSGQRVNVAARIGARADQLLQRRVAPRAAGHAARETVGPHGEAALGQPEVEQHKFPVGALFEVLRFEDRKSTRLNSSHVAISYAVFCLKKKKIKNEHGGKVRRDNWYCKYIR